MVSVPDARVLADIRKADPRVEPLLPGVARLGACDRPAPAPAWAGNRAWLFDAESSGKKAKMTATLAREEVVDGFRAAEASLSTSVAHIQLLPGGQLGELAFKPSGGQHRLEILRAAVGHGSPISAADSSQSLPNLGWEVEASVTCPPNEEWRNVMALTTASAMELQASEALDIGQGTVEARPTLLARRQSASNRFCWCRRCDRALSVSLKLQPVEEAFARRQLAKLASCAAMVAKDMRTALPTRRRLLGQGNREAAAARPCPCRSRRPRRGQEYARTGRYFNTAAARPAAARRGLKTAAVGGGAPKLDSPLLFHVAVQGSFTATESALFSKSNCALAFGATSSQRANTDRAVMNLTVPALDFAAAPLASSLAGST